MIPQDATMTIHRRAGACATRLASIIAMTYQGIEWRNPMLTLDRSTESSAKSSGTSSSAAAIALRREEPLTCRGRIHQCRIAYVTATGSTIIAVSLIDIAAAIAAHAPTRRAGCGDSRDRQAR